MEKDIDWEKIARLLEEANPSTDTLSEQELQAFWEVKEMWEDCRQLPQSAAEVSPEQLEKAKAEIWGRIDASEEASYMQDEAHTLHPKGKKLWPFIALAASVALLIGIFLVSPQMGSSPSSTFAAYTQGKYTLPDQTEVSLLSGSIKYEFNQELSLRKVELEGAARFQVAKNSEAPFVIDTEMGVTRVVGTAFKLHSEDQGQKPLLQVEEGVVAYMPKAYLKGEIYVRADEDLYFLKEDQAWKRVNNTTQSYVEWQGQTLAFDITLGELARLVSDMQEVEVVIQGEGLAELHVGTSGQGIAYDDVQEMLERALLPLSHLVQISFENDKWVIEQL